VKILITGSDSIVGRELLQQMGKDPEVMGITHNSMDLTDLERVMELFVKYKPISVIHADGQGDPDQCETQPWEALRSNVLTTQNLVLACLEHNAGLALLSSHHVFSGSKKGPYTEWDIADPLNVLGHSKNAAEMMVRNHLQRFHIIRSQGLFAKKGSNFVLRVLKSVVNNEPFMAPSDEFTMPTWIRDYAEAVARIVRGRIYGTFHVTNTGERSGISWADWARTILRIGGTPEHPVHEVSAQSLGRPARRPTRAILGNTFYRLQGFSMRSYEESLAAFFEDLAGPNTSTRQTIRARKAGLVYGDPPPPA
jgi:dTDP-4-dehydrorhamnose reductase